MNLWIMLMLIQFKFQWPPRWTLFTHRWRTHLKVMSLTSHIKLPFSFLLIDILMTLLKTQFSINYTIASNSLSIQPKAKSFRSLEFENNLWKCASVMYNSLKHQRESLAGIIFNISAPTTQPPRLSFFSSPPPPKMVFLFSTVQCDTQYSVHQK